MSEVKEGKLGLRPEEDSSSSSETRTLKTGAGAKKVVDGDVRDEEVSNGSVQGSETERDECFYGCLKVIQQSSTFGAALVYGISFLGSLIMLLLGPVVALIVLIGRKAKRSSGWRQRMGAIVLAVVAVSVVVSVLERCHIIRERKISFWFPEPDVHRHWRLSSLTTKISGYGGLLKWKPDVIQRACMLAIETWDTFGVRDGYSDSFCAACLYVAAERSSGKMWFWWKLGVSPEHMESWMPMLESLPSIGGIEALALVEKAAKGIGLSREIKIASQGVVLVLQSGEAAIEAPPLAAAALLVVLEASGEVVEDLVSSIVRAVGEVSADAAMEAFSQIKMREKDYCHFEEFKRIDPESCQSY
jgi:hypothetical protein